MKARQFDTKNGWAYDVMMSDSDHSPLLSSLGRHVLIDGFKIVLDLKRIHGSRLVDQSTGRTLLDLYGFYGSLPLGFHHSYFYLSPKRREQGTMIGVAHHHIVRPAIFSVKLPGFHGASLVSISSLSRSRRSRVSH